MLSISRAILRSLVILAASAPAAVGQCTTQWTTDNPYPGPDGLALCSTMWDADGAGPAPALLVVGGDFSVAGTVACPFLVAYDPVAGTWTSLGGGMNAPVRAVVAMPNGDLVAGGTFTSAGGAACNRIAKWNGSSWSALGAGFDGAVNALAVLGTGELVAGGEFTGSGAVVASCIARWDGASWSSLGTGVLALSPDVPSVQALVTLSNGDLIVGGLFTGAGGVPVGNVARWNGAWSAVGGGTNTAVLALTRFPNDDVVAGGGFTLADGNPAKHVARWNGASWSPMGNGMPLSSVISFAWVHALEVLPNGDVAAGWREVGIQTTASFARWNGGAWSAMGPAGKAQVRTLRNLPGGNLFAGGADLELAGTLISPFSRIWNGVQWSSMGPGFDGTIRALARRANGDLLAGGSFRRAGVTSGSTVALRSGTTWSTLGTQTGAVYATAFLPNGDPVIGTGAGVHRWSGTSWVSIGATMNGGVNALLDMPNGDLVAAGGFNTMNGVGGFNRIGRWNGSAWSMLGTGLNGHVHAIARLPNGDVIAAGDFTLAGGVPVGRVARWNGANWSAVGIGFPGSVLSLAVSPAGELFAGGVFTTANGQPANRIARFDGTAWLPLGAGTDAAVHAITFLPDGDLVAAGSFTAAGGVTAHHVARWNGATWSPFGFGVHGGVNTLALALTTTATGDLVIGGYFEAADEWISAFLARRTTTCPATAAPFGAGCNSSGGNNLLTATTLPWVGTTFTATGTGLPVNSLALTVTSVTPVAQGVVPLAGIFAQGGPGCDVLTAPDILGVVATTTGTAVSTLFLADTPPLAGVTFYHQLIPFDVAGPVTATNALQLTAGTF